MERLNWDQYFFEILEAVSKRTTCDRGRIGCVITKNNQILVTGYAGSPTGFPHCDEVGHQLKKVVHEDGSISEHCCRTIHAEQNAICQAARRGISIDGGTAYVSVTPCRICAMLFINCGIKEIKCKMRYHQGAESEKMFKDAKINLTFEDENILQY